MSNKQTRFAERVSTKSLQPRKSKTKKSGKWIVGRTDTDESTPGGHLMTLAKKEK